jgi:predicted DNA-binding transcriptional regulator AlpA
MDIKYEYLELIPELLEQNQALLERLNKLVPPLTTKKEVANFLGKSQSTINRYIQLGYLIEDVHFYRKNSKILVFIEDAITEFRKQLDKGLVYEKVEI